MIYRLKAPTRKDIEEQIPFALYSEDEEGNTVEHFADERFSYHFIGKEWITEPEYDEDGNVITEGEKSDYVLANLNVYNGQAIEFSDPVKRIYPDSPKHGWGKTAPNQDPKTGRLNKVSRWRLMIVLDEMGLLEQVNQAVSEAPKGVQIGWANANEITRDGKGMQMIQDALGISDKQVTKMFNQAEQIDL